MDKKFEGVEECMICFAVVHGTNYQLPTIICRVCKKGFHSACLVSLSINHVSFQPAMLMSSLAYVPDLH